jgi:hypothetical protein
MNPLRWKREHQLAWGIAGVLGAVAGLAYSFAYWQFRGGHGEFVAASTITSFLPYPIFYWPWLVIGAVIGMLAFYLTRLLK